MSHTMIQTSSGVIKALNRQLANWNVLYVKLHHMHWFVKGTSFFTLHEKFEKWYDQAAVYIDDLAERILAIHGTPLSTMKDYLANASIQEAKGNESAQQMVQTLLEDFSVVLRETEEGIKEAQKAGDESTADLLIGIHTDVEKQSWMLRAFLS